MGKTAFIFPGQGAQFVGMGKDIYKNYSVAKNTFEEANDILGYNLAEICFNGPENDLLLTKNTQPAILTTSVAILNVLKQKGLRCDFTAGLSLGEYTALVNAEALSFPQAVKLVQKRGIFMQEAAPVGVGAMGAVVGLSCSMLEEIIQAISKNWSINIANYNTHEQLVISGDAAAVKYALSKAKALGARKALKLPVSAPFHCRLMNKAGEMLEQELSSVTMNRPSVAFINNVHARVVHDVEEIKSSLVRQVSNSVLWAQSVGLLIEMGATRIIEIGPGSALTKFTKSIAAQKGAAVEALAVGCVEELDFAVSAQLL